MVRLSRAPDEERRPDVANIGAANSDQAANLKSGATLLAPSRPDETPKCCSGWMGIRFPDGVERCFRHASADDRALVADLDRRGRIIGLKKSADPRWHSALQWLYGPNIDVGTRLRMVEWAEKNDLRATKLGRHRCLTWLRNGRCRVCRIHPQWQDHVSAWTRFGQPACLLSQPYHLWPDDYAHLEALDADPELEVELKAEGSWYGYGTWHVAVWRADA